VVRIGLLREIKDNERRVGLTPGGVAELVHAGHEVTVEEEAGLGSGFPDVEYRRAGATLLRDRPAIAEADLLVKVKEPLASEYPLLRPGQILFTYLHLAASRTLTDALLRKRVIALAYETVQLETGFLPLLAPMSVIAGRLAVLAGAKLLESAQGGRGVLLGGAPGVEPAEVVIIGGGTVGLHAARLAHGIGARVTLLEKNMQRIFALMDILGNTVSLVAANAASIREMVRRAELVIGAVLVLGDKAPHVIDRKLLSEMKPGAVIVDVAIDQGGCCETSRPTTYSDPVFTVDGIIHYCVTNMPGAVARSATLALANATLPYIQAIANKGFSQAITDDSALARGVNTYQGTLTCQGVAKALDLPCQSVRECFDATRLN
jgi:alanine dehydrogenase